MTLQQLRSIVAIPVKRAVTVYHDGRSSISIHDKPVELPHSSPKKKRNPVTGDLEEVKKLQAIQMMDFQSKVTALLSHSFANGCQSLPLPSGEYSVEIIVQSHRTPEDLPLLAVMKSVIDGINKQIIADDHDVFKCRIQYKASKRKISLSQPKDFLTVTMHDMHTGKEVTGFRSVNVHVVPKMPPHVYDFDNDVYFYPDKELYYESVAEALLQDGMSIPSCGAYAVSMVFNGKVKNKDLDNMAKVYYPILHELGVKEKQVHSLTLIKQSPSTPNTSCIDISIRCN